MIACSDDKIVLYERADRLGQWKEQYRFRTKTRPAQDMSCATARGDTLLVFGSKDYELILEIHERVEGQWRFLQNLETGLRLNGDVTDRTFAWAGDRFSVGNRQTLKVFEKQAVWQLQQELALDGFVSKSVCASEDHIAVTSRDTLVFYQRSRQNVWVKTPGFAIERQLESIDERCAMHDDTLVYSGNRMWMVMRLSNAGQWTVESQTAGYFVDVEAVYLDEYGLTFWEPDKRTASIHRKNQTGQWSTLANETVQFSFEVTSLLVGGDEMMAFGSQWEVQRADGGRWSVVNTLDEKLFQFVEDGEFGRVIAMNKNWLAVASPETYDWNPLLNALGDVTLYHRASENEPWVFKQALEGPRNFNSVSESAFEFGRAMVMDDKHLIIASRESTDTALHIYELDGEQWKLVNRLPSPVQNQRIDFGKTLAVQGSTLVVGSGINAVFVYEKQDGDTTWTVPSTLIETEDPDGACFGCQIDVHDDVLVIGAPDALRGPMYGGGRVNVYRRQTYGQWGLESSLTSPSGEPGVSFGTGVSFDGEYLLVSSLRSLSFIRYNDVDKTWDTEQVVFGAEGEYFEGAVVLENKMAVVHTKAGIKVFERLTGTEPWRSSLVFRPKDVLSTSNYGDALAFNGDVFAASATDGAEGFFKRRVYLSNVRLVQPSVTSLNVPWNGSADIDLGVKTELPGNVVCKVVDSPQHGKLVEGTPWVYTAAQDYAGPDAFSYSCTVGDTEFGPWPVDVVIGDGAQMLLIAERTYTYTEEKGQLSIYITLAQGEREGARFKLVGRNGGATKGEVYLDQRLGAIRYYAKAGASEQDQIKLIATKGEQQSPEATLTITFERPVPAEKGASQDDGCQSAHGRPQSAGGIWVIVGLGLLVYRRRRKKIGQSGSMRC